MTQTEKEKIVSAFQSAIAAVDEIPVATEPAAPLKLNSKRVQAVWECIGAMESVMRKLINGKANGRLIAVDGVASDLAVNTTRTMLRALESVKSALTNENLDSAIMSAELIKQQLGLFVDATNADQLTWPDSPGFLDEVVVFLQSNADNLLGNFRYMKSS